MSEALTDQQINKNFDILIIEDEQIVSDEIARHLSKEGYRVLSAEDGKKGLQIFYETHPALVLLDLRMPVMDGFEFLERIDISPAELYSVIVLTGHGNDEDMERCFELGVSSFLRKPFNLYELKGLVKNLFLTNLAKSDLKTCANNLENTVKERTMQLERALKDLKRENSLCNQYKQELEESKDNFHNIVEKSTDGVVVIDTYGIVKFMNQTAETLLQRTFEDMQNKHFGYPIPMEGTTEINILQKNEHVIYSEMKTGKIEWNGTDACLALLRDITERKHMENRLRETSQMLEDLTHGISEHILLLDKDLKILWANKAALELTGIEPNDIIGHCCHNVTHLRDTPCKPPNDPCPVHELLSTGKPTTVFHTHFNRELHKQFVEVTVYPIRNEMNEIDKYVHISKDITDQKRMEEALKVSEKRYRDMIELLPVGISLSTPGRQGFFIDVNPSMIDMFGFDSKEEFLQYPLFSNFYDSGDFDKYLSLANNGPVHNYDVRLKRKDGNIFWASVSSISQKNDKGDTQHFNVYMDVTERKLARQRLEYMANFDALTDLPNRVLFFDRLKQSIKEASRNNRKLALLFVDLDRFKFINDTYGHSIGDKLLKEASSRLVNCVRKMDTVARMGGDEFAIILSKIKKPNDAGSIANKIIKAMSSIFFLDGLECSIGASIGISMYPVNGEEAEILLTNADTAMYSAKRSGRNKYRYFTTDLNYMTIEKHRIEKELRHAIQCNELLLYYQPQVNILTGEITGTEALLRWMHPERGVIEADNFIHTIKESEIIVPIGEWALNTACEQNKLWQTAGFHCLPVAVNITGKQFNQKFLIETITNVIDKTGLNPEYLELELTEELVMQNMDISISMLNELHKIGVRLTIDDFGTGYSSLSSLKLLPIEKIKIDRLLVRDIITNSDKAAVVDAIIAIARSLGVEVTAEGVETKEQLDFFCYKGCSSIQGFYISRPLHFKETLQFLEKGYSIICPEMKEKS